MERTPTLPSVTKPTGGGQHRLTVNLLPRASAALDEAHTLTGEAKTDCINRALLLYALVHRTQAEGGTLYIRETRDGETIALRVL